MSPEAAVKIEPPYGVIRNRLRKGLVGPFLGAGASMVGRPAGVPWDPQHPAFLPSGYDLAQYLAEETRFPVSEDRTDLAKISSYYVDVSGRRALRECLHELLDRPVYTPGPLHALLAAVPAPLVIVSTNYDTLIEQAFQAAGKSYDLLAYPADRRDVAGSILWWRAASCQPEVVAPNELDLDLAHTTVIYKMHGTVVSEAQQWDSFVITEEDYVEFLSRMTSNTAVPALFYPHFRERSFLFLGYGLRDWNLRVVLKNLSRHFAARAAAADEDDVVPSWAIQLAPSELERRLWAKRNVNIFDLTLDEFVTNLRQRLGG
jgi:hypothetical protein